MHCFSSQSKVLFKWTEVSGQTLKVVTHKSSKTEIATLKDCFNQIAQMFSQSDVKFWYILPKTMGQATVTLTFVHQKFKQFICESKEDVCAKFEEIHSRWECWHIVFGRMRYCQWRATCPGYPASYLVIAGIDSSHRIWFDQLLIIVLA